MKIKELADGLGVSKTAIRKYMTPEFRAEFCVITENSVIEISDSGCRKVAEMMGKPLGIGSQKIAETTENTANQSEVEFLRKQIEEKDLQIAALQEALKAEQALHAAALALPAPKPSLWQQIFGRKPKNDVTN